jgi:hypothetical protein
LHRHLYRNWSGVKCSNCLDARFVRATSDARLRPRRGTSQVKFLLARLAPARGADSGWDSTLTTGFGTYRKLASCSIFGRRANLRSMDVSQAAHSVLGVSRVFCSSSHWPIGFWTGTSVEIPHWVTVKFVGADEGMTYQVPFEGRHTAKSVFPSPS